MRLRRSEHRGSSLAFERANPRYGDCDGDGEATGAAAGPSVAYPLPGCLTHLLEKNLLASWQRDAFSTMHKAVVSESTGIKAVLNAHRPALRRCFDHARQADGQLGSAASAKTLGAEAFCRDLFDRKVAREVVVAAPGSGSAAPQAELRCHLSWLDCKGAFASGLAAADRAAAKGGADGEAAPIEFSEFLEALAVCGLIKYEEVQEMSLAQRVSGILANYLGEKDEHAVITEAVVKPIVRFDASAITPLPNQSAGEHAEWIATWGRMELSHVDGFPAWEEEVFEVLRRSYAELASTFGQYALAARAARAKTGGAKAGDARAPPAGGGPARMTHAELTRLAHDCGLASDAFPMIRVLGVLRRAQRPIELHEFFEMVVSLGFERGRVESPPLPLPGCLESLLSASLLRQGGAPQSVPKQLLLMKAALGTDSEAKAVLSSPRYKAPLREAFDALAATGPRNLFDLFGKSGVPWDASDDVRFAICM